MQLDTQVIDMKTRVPIVILHEDDAKEIGAYPLDRIQLTHNGKTTNCVVDTTEELVNPGTVLLTQGVDHIEGEVTVSLAPKPQSVQYIRKKLRDKELEQEEIEAIINDINHHRLSDIEMGAYVSAMYANELSMREVADLTNAMVAAGDTLEWEYDLLGDKHSIGGVPGNRVTPIIVPIIAAAGIPIPKTSSRAITSPAGTADTMEVFCDVDFSLGEIRDIVEETGGCMVWGGSVKLSPVDDKIIRAEHPLSIDPEGQVIASVLSKKKAAGSTHVIIDIPYGEGSKVGDTGVARDLAEKFKHIGDMLDMQVSCTITKGSQPIGNGIGPTLEAIDILNVLNNNIEEAPKDLYMKSIRLADALFELCGVDEDAATYIETGAALEKFREIIAAQDGDPDISVDTIPEAAYQHEYCAEQDGVVSHINNKAVAEGARRAGAPKDQAAGVVLKKKTGATVEEGECLMVIHAETEEKLEEARATFRRMQPFRVLPEYEMLIEEV